VASTRTLLADPPSRGVTGFAFNSHPGVFHVGNNRLLAYQSVTSPSAMILRESLDAGATWDDDIVSGSEISITDWRMVWDPGAQKIVAYRGTGVLMQYRVFDPATNTWTDVVESDPLTDPGTGDGLSGVGVGTLSGITRDLTAGNHSLYRFTLTGDEEIVKEQGDDVGTWGDPFNLVVVLDAVGREHQLWAGGASTSRSSLNTWWHRYETDSTIRALKTDIAQHHGINDEIRPVTGLDGKLYVGFTARDASLVERLWLGIFDPATTTWSTELVNAAWETRNTRGVATAVDRVGQVFLLTIGEIDAEVLNTAQVYLFKRDVEAAWTYERIAPNAVNVGSTGTANIAPLEMGTQFSRLPQVGAYFVVQTNWDSGSVVKSWSVIADGTLLTQDEDRPGDFCAAEPARTTVSFDNEGSSEATLALIPDFAYEEEERYFTSELRTAGGYVVSSAQQPSSRRLFRIGFRSRAEVDRDAMLTFLDARKGGVASWTFVRPPEEGGGGGDSVTVHLVAETFEDLHVSAGVYDFEILGQELLNTS
jgi:hypothetical protein